MARSTLISVRMPGNLVNEITQLAKQHSYLTRSSVICNILKNVCECANVESIERLASMYDCYGDGYFIHMTRKEKNFTNL